jgi:uncharacterized membrane protein
MGFALALHTLLAVVWVGGMFFAYVCLRPALGAFEGPARARLWAAVLPRFFIYVLAGIPLLLATGLYMIDRLGGMKSIGPHIHIMLGLGVLMMLLALHVFFAPLKRLRRAVTAGDFTDAAKRIGQIRKFVAINLLIGLVVVAVASGGRYLLG